MRHDSVMPGRKMQVLGTVALALALVAGIAALQDTPWLAISAGVAGALLALWLGYRAQH